jgi:hypothetical protein
MGLARRGRLRIVESGSKNKQSYPPGNIIDRFRAIKAEAPRMGSSSRDGRRVFAPFALSQWEGMRSADVVAVSIIENDEE